MLRDIPAFASFSIDDIAKAKEFYGHILGLRLNTDLPDVLRLDLADGNCVLAYQKLDHVPATFTLLNFQVSNLERVMGDLLARGVKFEHYIDGSGMATNAQGISEQGAIRLAWFKDPAGNTHSLMEGM
jgi:catechol 2,3-dioxygenase-like lactoylglutathione lyase family enzyme